VGVPFGKNPPSPSVKNTDGRGARKRTRVYGPLFPQNKESGRIDGGEVMGDKVRGGTKTEGLWTGNMGKQRNDSWHPQRKRRGGRGKKTPNK